ncbi:adenylosuccinate synthase [bacterium]|nr:adenylosuccinate synthase [bacterium]
MANIVIVGAQWGDEGKGKITDLLAEEADIVVRYQGGSNAGHTVKVGEEVFRLHHIPSGILYPGKLCIIADGMVVDPEVLKEEVEELVKRGLSVEGLRISLNAHIVMPYHRILDGIWEARMGKGRIGTTGRGIGPCYADKAARIGIRMSDLLVERLLKEKLAINLEEKNLIISHYRPDLPPLKMEDLLPRYLELGEFFRPYVVNTSQLIHQAMDEKKNILFEGAQGTLLDINYGTYPFVTSSHPIAGGVCIGAGIGPRRIDKVIGVCKAYITRVGEGPFPTEIIGEVGDYLRERGAEYGTTTGRPRRCGWLDLVALKHAVKVNGLDGLAITKLDVLTGLPKLKICVAYRIDGQETDVFPVDANLLKRCEPVYEELPGWERLEDVDDFADLPKEAQDYLRFISSYVALPICIVSLGPRREQTLGWRVRKEGYLWDRIVVDTVD